MRESHALRGFDQPHAAVASHDFVIEIRPASAEAFYNRGVAVADAAPTTHSQKRATAERCKASGLTTRK